MRIVGNEIIIQRGETFGLDYSIYNKDGTPYTINKEYINSVGKEAYFLFSIASARYDTADRYVRHWWLPVQTFITEPDDIKVKPDGIPANDKGYLYKDDDGKYYIVKNGAFEEYVCRFVKHFSSDDTDELVEQNYIYSLNLVTGNSVDNYISNICEQFNITDVGDTLNERRDNLAIKLLELGKVEESEYVNSLNVDRALATFDVNRVIIPVSKLTVTTKLTGGFISI